MNMRGSLAGQIGYALVALVAVALAATVKTDGYVANILMQAATYAIAVFGLSIVLGLCRPAGPAGSSASICPTTQPAEPG